MTMVETLETFGYHFNGEGQLRRIVDGSPFVFNINDGNDLENQRAYEHVADALITYLLDQIVNKYQYSPVILPIDAALADPHCFIYESPDARTNPEKLLLIIQGSGAVRPGMWSRSAIINQDLACGSIFPYLEKAKELGYGVIVLNPNQNTSQANGLVVPIPGNEQAQAHVAYVWENIVKKCAAKQVDIVAHSFGGVSTCALHKKFPDELERRVGKIAFTDAVHAVHSLPDRTKQFIAERAINWVRSDRPLDAFVENPRNRGSGCLCISAGHPQHEYTSGYCYVSVFSWLSGEKEYRS